MLHIIWNDIYGKRLILDWLTGIYLFTILMIYSKFLLIYQIKLNREVYYSGPRIHEQNSLILIQITWIKIGMFLWFIIYFAWFLFLRWYFAMINIKFCRFSLIYCNNIKISNYKPFNTLLRILLWFQKIIDYCLGIFGSEIIIFEVDIKKICEDNCMLVSRDIIYLAFQTIFSKTKNEISRIRNFGCILVICIQNIKF
jgi:hypothetical protein